MVERELSSPRIESSLDKPPRPGVSDLFASGGIGGMILQTGHSPRGIRPPQIQPATCHHQRVPPLQQHPAHLVMADQKVVGPLQGDMLTQHLRRLPARHEGQQTPLAPSPPRFTGHRNRHRSRCSYPIPAPSSPTMFLTVCNHHDRPSPISSAGVVLSGSRDGQPNQPIWCSQRGIPQVQVLASLSKR